MRLWCLVAFTATMEGDSWFSLFSLFLFWQQHVKSHPKVAADSTVVCANTAVATKRRRSAGKQINGGGAGATRASETDQPVWSTNQLLFSWQKMIYWLHQATSAIHPPFFNRAIVLGWVWGEGCWGEQAGEAGLRKHKVLLHLKTIWF